MKKIITICLIGLTCATGLAQEVAKKNLFSSSQNSTQLDSNSPISKEKNYNTWSLNLNGGYNVAVGPFTPGYFSARGSYFKSPSLNHVDLNVRKMFNTKFGILFAVGYDKFTDDGGASKPFRNHMYTSSLQGVFNIHRALNWEEFTKTFGLQLHAGAGFNFLEDHRTRPVGSTVGVTLDNIYTVVSGAKLLVKVNDRLAFNLDYTMNKNFSHNETLDGLSEVDLVDNRTGIVHTASIGANFYLGKKEKHADWYWENKVDKTESLLAKINKIEEQLKDGNNNKFPDSFEPFVNNKVDNIKIINNNIIGGDTNSASSNAKNLINSQYVNVFFDFDKSHISTGSISAINFLIKYLNDNPEAKVDVIGYADELGNIDYNLRLSETRAKKVAEMIVRSGIDASRLTVISKGEDNSVPKESSLARQLVRRVAFEVK